MSADNLIAETKLATCSWHLDDVDGFYETECGHAFQFNEGTLGENDAKFCIYCGKPILASATGDNNDE